MPTPIRQIAALVLTATFLAAPAAAQRIPERLDARDLDRYARILELSPEQRNAAYGLYEQYVEEFEELLGAFVEAEWETPTATFAEYLERWQTTMKSRIVLRDQIRAMETSLIDRLTPLLTEDQTERLPRVRDDRFRRTAFVGGFFNEINGPYRSTISDLSLLIRRLDLSAEEWERVDPILANYEQRLTALYRQLEPRAMAYHELDSREIIARGLGDTSVYDMETWEEIATSVWETKGNRAIEFARSIDDLNLKTAREVESVLDQPNADRWMHVYLQEAIGPHAGVVHTQQYLMGARRVLNQLKLSDAKRQSLEPLIVAYELRTRQRLKKHLDEDHEALQPDHRFAFSTKSLEHRNRAQSERPREDELWNQLELQIERELGKRIADRFRDAFRKRNPERTALSEGFGRPVTLWDGPLAITESEFTHWLSLLNLTETQGAAANVPFGDYAFRANSLPKRPDAERYFPVSEEELAHIRPLDDQLLAALASLLETDDQLFLLDIIRRSRKRVRFGLHNCGSVAGSVDPLTLLIHSGLEGTTIAAAVRESAIDLDEIDSNLEAEWRAGLEQAQWRYKQQAGQLNEEQRQEWSRQAIARQTQQADRALLHVQHMERIRDALPQGDGAVFWDRFMQLAFSYLIDDANRLDVRLDEAMKREDLLADQRRRLENLVLSYRSNYNELTIRMFDLAKHASHWSMHHDEQTITPLVGSDWEVPNAYRALKLERDDLNDLTRLELDLILDPHDDGGG